jgi:hypothetical protein
MDKQERRIAWRVALWDEINKYVIACGGDPSKHVYGNVSRMNAVVDVESCILRAHSEDRIWP